MAFSDKTISAAYLRSRGNCECERKTHNHSPVRCNKALVHKNQGREGQGAWEAHHLNANGGDELSNCQILCWDCHKLTF